MISPKLPTMFVLVNVRTLLQQSPEIAYCFSWVTRKSQFIASKWAPLISEVLSISRAPYRFPQNTALKMLSACLCQKLMSPHVPCILRHPQILHFHLWGPSFSFAAPKLWNNLLVNIRTMHMSSLDSFKRKHKTHLFQDAFLQHYLAFLWHFQHCSFCIIFLIIISINGNIRP